MSVRWNRWLGTFLVLVALTYALLPDGPPLAQANGSAFSATTSDVALNCGVRPEIERRVLPDRPAPPPPPRCAVIVAALVPTFVPASLQNGHRAAAPPVSLPALLTALSPRAPPAA
jgi:hypothetical protein